MSDQGYAFAYGACWSCGNLFTFDPDRVPSVAVDPVTNTPPDLIDPPDPAAYERARREPVCRDCTERANDLRREHGRPEIVVLPGAYP